MNDLIWMKKALSLSEKSRDLDEVPIGAVLVAEQKVIGQGINLREKRNSVISHAEIRALENYSRRFKNWRLPKTTTLYVPLEPCLMCAGALLQARVTRIVFATTDTKNAGLLLLKDWIAQNKFDHTIELHQLLECKEQASQLLSQYFKVKRTQHKFMLASNALNTTK